MGASEGDLITIFINILIIILLKLNPITPDSQAAGDPPDGGDGLPVSRASAVQD